MECGDMYGEQGMENSASAAVRERRRFPRVTGCFPLQYKVIDPETSIQPYSAGTTVDIARGGLRFLTERELQIGDCLAVHMSIPGRDRLIAALTEVLRVIQRDEGKSGSPPSFEIGVCFLWSGWHDGAMQREISDFVRTELENRGETFLG